MKLVQQKFSMSPVKFIRVVDYVVDVCEDSCRTVAPLSRFAVRICAVQTTSPTHCLSTSTLLLLPWKNLVYREK